MITDYKIVYGYSQENLEEYVKRFVKLGWQPLGSPIMEDRSSWYQAMTFSKEPKKQSSGPK